jgi:hypothetical protein
MKPFQRSVVVALAWLACGPAAACGGEPLWNAEITSIPYRGVNSITTPSHTSSENTERDFIATEVARAAELGANVIRYPVEWGAIETAKGVRQETENRWFRSLQQMVAEAESKGIKILATVAGTPAYASAGSGSKAPEWAPSEPEASLRPFARWLVEKFGKDLVAVGVWNEPDRANELESPDGAPLQDSIEHLEQLAGYYVPMVKAVHEGVREGNESVKTAVKVAALESGESKGDDVEGVNKDKTFVKACFHPPGGAPGISPQGKPLYDIWSTHAYSEEGNLAPEAAGEWSTKGKVEGVHRLLETEEGEAPIWVTEWGWQTPKEVTEAQQAEYVERGVTMLNTTFDRYVEGFTYFLLHGPSAETTEHQSQFGLLEGLESNSETTETNFKERESFKAFKRALETAGSGGTPRRHGHTRRARHGRQGRDWPSDAT